MAAEASLERAVVAWCKKQGYGCEKLVLASQAGWPDRCILLPDNKVIFAELKAKNGSLSPQQRYWLKMLKEWGHLAIVPRSLEEVIDAVARLSSCSQ